MPQASELEPFLDILLPVEAVLEGPSLRVGELMSLKAGSVVLAEHFKKFDPGDKFGELRRYRTLVQGDAVLSFYRRSTAIT